VIIPLRTGALNPISIAFIGEVFAKPIIVIKSSICAEIA
jgi:hypothetical protein